MIKLRSKSIIVIIRWLFLNFFAAVDIELLIYFQWQIQFEQKTYFEKNILFNSNKQLTTIDN